MGEQLSLVPVMFGADPVTGIVSAPWCRKSLELRGRTLARVDAHEVCPGVWSWGVCLPGYERRVSARWGLSAESSQAAFSAGIDELSERIAAISSPAAACSTPGEISLIKSWIEKEKGLI